MGERLIVRSYRRVFRIDRRIYRVDRWVLPIPGGVPLRGVCYFAAALGLVLLAGRLPVIAELPGALSPPLRYVIVPLAVAVLGSRRRLTAGPRTGSPATGCACSCGRGGARRAVGSLWRVSRSPGAGRWRPCGMSTRRRFTERGS